MNTGATRVYLARHGRTTLNAEDRARTTVTAVGESTTSGVANPTRRVCLWAGDVVHDGSLQHGRDTDR